MEQACNKHVCRARHEVHVRCRLMSASVGCSGTSVEQEWNKSGTSMYAVRGMKYT
jgi:hypothetical protein